MRDHGSGVAVTKLVSRKTVCEMLEISQRSLSRLVANETLPPPVYLTAGMPRWDRGTIELHLERLGRKRRPVNHTTRKGTYNGDLSRKSNHATTDGERK